MTFLDFPIDSTLFRPFTAGNLGLLGDYVGGILGTAVSGLALVIVFFTWVATRGGEHRSRTYQIVAEMIRAHESIIGSLRLGKLEGREAFSDILGEFHLAYRIVNLNAGKSPSSQLSINYPIDIAYTFTSYESHVVALSPLERHGEAFIKNIASLLSAERAKNFKAKDWFAGHQNRLSQYFRNLYRTYRFIDQSQLPRKDKVAFDKVLRTKLLNYEQALLALNVISNLGRRWETTGLLDRHAPIRNIPKRFFTFEPKFVVQERFRSIEYEWEEQATSHHRIW
jgi:hypothetical protein